MQQLLEFRLPIEAHCARVGAARGDEAVIAALARCVDAMAAMRRAGVIYDGYQAYLALEQEFRRTIVESAGNAPIAAAHRGLDLVLSVARRSVVRDSGRLGSDDAVNEHREIVAAYEPRDPEHAETAVRRHITAAQARMRSL